MSTVSAVVISLLICAAAVALEGLFAGKNVKPFMEKLRLPRFAPPFWTWIVIGILYYVTYFFILFRILRYSDNVEFRRPALALALIVLALNALWNYFFFRRKNLSASFALGIGYSLIAIALFVCLWQFDYVAAFAQIPYLIYLLFAFYWSYGLLRLNARHS